MSRVTKLLFLFTLLLFFTFQIDKVYFYGRYIYQMRFYLSRYIKLVPEPRLRNSVLKAKTGDKDSYDSFSVRGDVLSIDDLSESIILKTVFGKKSFTFSQDRIKKNEIRFMLHDRDKRDVIAWKSLDSPSINLSQLFCVGDFIDVVEGKEYALQIDRTLLITYVFIMERPNTCSKN